MYDGVINVYKEKGYTSHDVVAKLRGILRQKKIGHTGTLDPDATGVLPVCLGSATKLCDMLADKSKTYRTVMKLGIVTDTQDITGKILADKTAMKMPDSDSIKETVMSFFGEYDQIPPMYSALKVNGKKLYELARAGIEVERKARKVTINSIDIEDINGDEVTFTVDCSKGTYIRTLCNDIGEKLSVGACMKSLERTRVSAFLLKDALTLAQIEEKVKNENINENIIPVDKMFEDLTMLVMKNETDRLLLNGNKLVKTDFALDEIDSICDEQMYRVYDSNRMFKAVYRYEKKSDTFIPVKMFLG